jgi:hypothetical protein
MRELDFFFFSHEKQRLLNIKLICSKITTEGSEKNIQSCQLLALIRTQRISPWAPWFNMYSTPRPVSVKKKIGLLVLHSWFKWRNVSAMPGGM